MVDPNFYRAFEERHRGSRELIKSRLEVYLPFILPLKQLDGSCQGIDLGCGRGEWLELMQENGINIQGVDLDQGMLDAARERDLNVSQGDAIQILQSLASKSQMLVSGFHIAEHLPFDVLHILIQESLRVLKPGGLMILETPNPENIVVGTASFYLDPTHQQPIPLQLLSFMVEYSGFEKVKVLRLQETSGLVDNNELTLLNVLNGVSPDYAVVAQKGGAPEIAAAIAPAFETDYGASLEGLAKRYNEQAETKVQQAKAKAEQAEAKAEQAEAKAEQAEAKAEQAEAKAEQAEAKAEHSVALVNSLLKSKSWRVTAPIRYVKGYMNDNVTQLFRRVVVRIGRKLYISTRPLWLRHTTLKQLALSVILRFPALHRAVIELVELPKSEIDMPDDLLLTYRLMKLVNGNIARIDEMDQPVIYLDELKTE